MMKTAIRTAALTSLIAAMACSVAETQLAPTGETALPLAAERASGVAVDPLSGELVVSTTDHQLFRLQEGEWVGLSLGVEAGQINDLVLLPSGDLAVGLDWEIMRYDADDQTLNEFLCLLPGWEPMQSRVTGVTPVNGGTGVAGVQVITDMDSGEVDSITIRTYDAESTQNVLTIDLPTNGMQPEALAAVDDGFLIAEGNLVELIDESGTPLQRFKLNADVDVQGLAVDGEMLRVLSAERVLDYRLADFIID